MALSTSEVEYVAMTHGAKIAMYEDNEGANMLAANPQGSHRGKQWMYAFTFCGAL